MHSNAIKNARMMRPFPTLSREATPQTSPARKCGVSRQSEPELPSGDDTCAHTFTHTAFLAMIKIGYPDSTQLAPLPSTKLRIQRYRLRHGPFRVPHPYRLLITRNT